MHAGVQFFGLLEGLEAIFPSDQNFRKTAINAIAQISALKKSLFLVSSPGTGSLLKISVASELRHRTLSAGGWSFLPNSPKFRLSSVMVVERPAQSLSSSAVEMLETILLHGGAHIANVQVREPSPGHRGLFATSDLPTGTPFVRIPASKLISSTSARRAPHVAAVLSAVEADRVHERLPDALGDSAAILLFLMAEFVKEDASEWKLWFNSLPTQFYTPFAMDMDDVDDLLSGTTLLSLVETLRQELKEMYDDWFVPYAVIKNPDVYAEDRCSFKKFLYAHSIIESRAFKIDDVTMLVPFADMANHQPNESPLRTAKARGWTLIDSSGPANTRSELGLELHVGDQPVRRGQELCISYGALPNWQLLLHYGFALPSNPEDSVVVSLQVPDDDPQPLYMLKMLFLNIDVMPDIDVDHALREQDPLPASLLASTRLLLLDEGEASSISISTANFGNPVSARNEQAVATQLRSLVESMLSGFDVFEDGADHGDRDSFASSCGIYVNGQRRILTKAIDALEVLSANTNTLT